MTELSDIRQIAEVASRHLASGTTPDSAGHDAVVDALNELATTLRRFRDWWHPRPFTNPMLPWELTHPDVATWLRSLDAEEIDRIEETPSLLVSQTVPMTLSDMADVTQALGTVLRQLPDAQIDGVPPTISKHALFRVPGRKQEQIRDLLRVAGDGLGSVDVVADWCGGKAHAGRTVAAASGVPNVLLVERDPVLARDAIELGARVGVDVATFVGDAHAIDADTLFDRGCREETDVFALALHACGDLTDRFLDVCSRGQIRRYIASPCCFHLVHGGAWTPRSAAGAQFNPQLDQTALRLAIADETKASSRVRQHRRREMLHRLTWEVSEREQHGGLGYAGLRALKPAEVRQRPAELLRTLRLEHGRPLLGAAELERLCAQGDEALRWVRARGLVRAMWRRPIELWLALDRVCGQLERGATVRAGFFTDRAATARNVLIDCSRD